MSPGAAGAAPAGGDKISCTSLYARAALLPDKNMTAWSLNNLNSIIVLKILIIEP